MGRPHALLASDCAPVRTEVARPWVTRWRRAAFLGAALACGCGGASRGAATARTWVSSGARRPALAVVEREGDAAGAVAVAVETAGVGAGAGAEVGVALGALVEARLASSGVREVSVAGGGQGWRLRALVASPAAASRLLEAIRVAMLAPVLPGDPALAAVGRRVAALAARPLPNPAFGAVARCTGEAYGTPGLPPPTPAELEAWRTAAHRLGRVAVATTGDAALTDAVASALARGPEWPAGGAVAPNDDWADADRAPAVYDASGDVAPGAARLVATAWTGAPERAVAAASTLVDARGPLASRLAALDAPGHLRSVTATAHADGGCLAVTIDLSAHDLAGLPAARIAEAASLAAHEIELALAGAGAPSDLARTMATRASDPREAAELAAWWQLAAPRPGAPQVRLSWTIGVAPTRDARPAPNAADPPSAPSSDAVPKLAEAVRAELDRAEKAWRAPVVEARTRVERGQGELWVLLASPCGTAPESARDAGTSAAVAVAAAALQSAPEAGDVQVEPFVAADGVGVIAHGAARAGESPDALATRVADLAARPFASDALDRDRITRARTTLLARARDVAQRGLDVLAGALAPNHPSWVYPLGTAFGLGGASDESIAARAAALRAGPLRAAVIANVDETQADAAIRAVDRWVARRPSEGRACPAVAALAPVRAGTYAVEVPAGGASQALLAIPLPPADETARQHARWVAAALDGPDGLLARALRRSPPGEAAGAASMADDWGASVVGGPRSPALVVRLTAPDGLLDAAVAQTRALLDRVRDGALRDDDRARAAAAIDAAALEASLDPRARAVALWRGDAGAPPPTLDALRGFAAGLARDEAMVIVAMRPPRTEPTAEHAPAEHESKPAGRDLRRP